MGGNNQVQQDALILKQQRSINHKALTQSYYYSHSLTLTDSHWHYHWHSLTHWCSLIDSHYLWHCLLIEESSTDTPFSVVIMALWRSQSVPTRSKWPVTWDVETLIRAQFRAPGADRPLSHFLKNLYGTIEYLWKLQRTFGMGREPKKWI